jgi:hypothetical protein
MLLTHVLISVIAALIIGVVVNVGVFTAFVNAGVGLGLLLEVLARGRGPLHRSSLLPSLYGRGSSLVVPA